MKFFLAFAWVMAESQRHLSWADFIPAEKITETSSVGVQYEIAYLPARIGCVC